MSATGVPNRDGVTRTRNPDDFYATPAWATRAILRAAFPNAPSRLLDPAAGDGAILAVAREMMPDTRLTAFEINATHDRKYAKFASVTGVDADGFMVARHQSCLTRAMQGGHVVFRDSLATPPWKDETGQRFDLILANPPFKLAMEFLERALAEVEFGGEVAFLLRLCFLASMKRAAFHRSHPCDIYILPKRPSFTPDGRTDSADYAWFVYGPGHAGAWSILAPLHHREEAELEPRVLDLLARVLVAILQPGKPHDPHDDHRVARVEEHLGRLLGDGHVDAVPLTHGGDRRLV
jgi:hypothetical protein